MPRSPFIWLLPAAVGLLLAVSMAPFSRYFLDDWVHLYLLQEGDWGIYRFAAGEAALNQQGIHFGALPWFATPELKITFFRPLSAALHALDGALFGRDLLPRVLHSVAWYAALCGVVTAIFRRILPPQTALLAAVFFAIAGAHAQPVVWLAARNALICATLGGLGLLAHLAWRDGLRPGVVLSVIGLGAGLFAGEAGLGIVAFVVAYELVGRRDPLGRRLFALLPAAGITLAWLVLYLAVGAGVSGSGAYLDPVHEPLRFLAHAPWRLAYVLGVVTSGISADIWYLRPQDHTALSVLGALCALPFLAWLGSTLAHAEPVHRRAVGWLALGAGLALIPQLAGLLGSRSVLVPSIGGTAVPAVLVVDGLGGRGGMRTVRRIGAGLLLLGHGVFAMLQWPLTGGMIASGGVTTDRALADLRAMDLPPDTPVLLVSTPGPELATYATLRGRVTGEPVPSLMPLVIGPRPVRVLRVDRLVWEVEPLEGDWIEGGFDRLYRVPGTLPTGTGVQVPPLSATVLDAVGGDPTRVRFTANRYAVLVGWDGQHMVRVDPALDEVVELRP